MFYIKWYLHLSPSSLLYSAISLPSSTPYKGGTADKSLVCSSQRFLPSRYSFCYINVLKADFVASLIVPLLLS